MANKSERKKKTEQRTRHAILTGSVTVLQKHGLNNFTMDRVADEAEIAKGTLYRYFKNKDELLLSTADYCFEPLTVTTKEIFNSSRNPLDKLEQYVVASFVHTEQNRALYYDLKVVLLDMIVKDLNDKTSTYWEIISIFARTFQDGVDQKLLKPMNTEKVALFFIDSIDRAMTRRIFSTVDDSAENDARDLLNIYLHGLAL